jgi:hypothetical protein
LPGLAWIGIRSRTIVAVGDAEHEWLLLDLNKVEGYVP